MLIDADIPFVFVGHDAGGRRHVLFQCSVEVLRRNPLHRERSYAPSPLDQGYNRRHVVRWPSLEPARLPLALTALSADVGFVSFDDTGEERALRKLDGRSCGSGRICFMKRSVMCLVFSSVLALPVLAQGPFCNQYLVPIPLGSYSGANGSLWNNDLWIRNDSDSARLVTQRQCVADFHGCQNVSSSQTLPARATMRLTPLAGSENIVDGQFVYVDDPTDMFFGLRSRDMNTTSAGTSIPVVSSKSGKKRQQLLNVPIDSRYRYSLRVYVFGHDSAGGAQGAPQNRIRVYDSPSRVLLIDQALPFNGFEDDSTCSGFPYPYQNAASDPFAGQTGLSGKTVRIEIESDFYVFWAMLTITNNATNEVTAIVP